MTGEVFRRRFSGMPIGNYYYTVINRGFDDYIVIGKHPIINAVEEQWEDEE